MLHVAELLKDAPATIRPRVAFDMLGKIREYRLSATSAIGEIAKSITKISSDGGIALGDDTNVKLPFVAHHANTELVVSTLQKAIEHTIDLNIGQSSESPFGAEVYGAFASSDNWMNSLKCLLACLLALEKTDSGRCAARPAFHCLLNRYGDFLMECWTPGE